MNDPLLLVVEGPDDKHVIWAILQHHAFTPEFPIREQGGVERLLEILPVLLKSSELERLGIVVDADAHVGARWESLKRILIQARYTQVPADPNPEGTVVHHGDLPTVGIWIMPDNVLPGMLEDYIAYLVPEGDALWDRASQCLDEIPTAERRFSPNSLPKALIHTWLAWQQDPGTPLGLAITKRYLDPESPHVTKFLGWLTRLFA